MEKEKKTRGKIFLTIVVTINILFSVASIGFLIYKVRWLEEQVFQLQKRLIRDRPDKRTTK